MLKNPLMLLVAVFFAAVVSGCGYHVAGKGGAMPGGIKELSIPVFTNTTSKPDIEATITSAFVNEFITTVEVLNESEFLLQGTIKSYALNPVSFTKSDVNQEYRLTVVIDVRLFDKETGRMYWIEENITDYEDFTVNINDVSATRDAETAALRKLSKDTARATKERMLERF
ncbi:MAG: hypothetical protein HYS21_07380 [Deltaproteobacteria bacterium]|nr:hypothetical protein [Deltaproteobacteria bacterium]